MKQNLVMTIIGWILTAAISALLTFSAVMKFLQPKEVLEGFQKSGYPDGTLIPIGIAEVVSTLLFLFPKTRVLGAVLLTGYLGGAINHHVRAGEGLLVQALFGVAVWLALFLRDPVIRGILPFWMIDAKPNSETLKS